MTANEKRIAEEAISRQRDSYRRTWDEVAEVIGVGKDVVKKTLDDLSSRHVLKMAATPARNVLEDAKARDEPTRGWYEKGSLWPKE